MRIRRKKAALVNQSRQMLEELYQLHEKQMYYMAYDILKNKQQAEDVIHDTFLKFLPYLDDFTDAADSNARHLLLRMTRNTAIDVYRKNKKETSLDLKIIPEDSSDVLSQSLEDREELEAIFQMLSPEQSEIIKLRCFYGFTTKETAARLQISEETARKRFWRARESVKTWKGEQYHEKQNIKFNTL